MGRNPLTIDQQQPGNSPGELQNSAAIHFWLGSAPEGPVTVEITSPDGAFSVTEEIQAHAGINRWFWDLRFPPPAVGNPDAQGQVQGMRAQAGGGFGMQRLRGAEAQAGSYLVRITANGRTVEGTLDLRDDPGLDAILPTMR